MSEKFEVVDLPGRPYVAVSSTVTMESLEQVADRLPEVFGWLDRHDLDSAGPPFLRYLTFGAGGALRVAAGVPLVEEVPADPAVSAGVIPAGRYVRTTYVGHPRGLRDATARLLGWADDEDLVWDRREGPHGEEWAARLEWLETDPRQEPDPERWRTRLELRLAD